MNATTLTAAGEENVMQHDGDPPIDLAALARKREERFQDRKKRIEADPSLTDTEQRWYLDRTLIGTREQAAMIGRTKNRVTIMRRDRGGRRRAPHPMILPDVDEYVGNVAGVLDPGIEAGRLRKHLVENGTHDLNPETGEMVRIADYRPGAPRHQRATRTKPGRKGPSIPGQPTGD